MVNFRGGLGVDSRSSEYHGGVHFCYGECHEGSRLARSSLDWHGVLDPAVLRLAPEPTGCSGL